MGFMQLAFILDVTGGLGVRVTVIPFHSTS